MEPVSVFILYVRSYFISEKSHKIFITKVLPFITFMFFFLNVTMSPTYFNAFTHFSFCLWLGTSLITYDLLGSKISHDLCNNEVPLLCLTTLTGLSNSSNVFKRHFGWKAISGVIIGTTKMSSTGRASLIVGTCTGGTWLFNEYKNRQAANQRSDADRQAADQRFHAQMANDAANRANDAANRANDAANREAQGKKWFWQK